MPEQWEDAAAAEEVAEGETIGVAVDGHEIALYNVEGAIFATSNICTHGHAQLCEGYLEGHEIECPLHQGRFDVRSGKALCAPLIGDVRTYPIKVENGRVFVDLANANTNANAN